MRTIQKSLKILSVRGIGETVYLEVQFVAEPLPISQPSRMPRPEDVIQPLPKSETEKIVREQVKATVDEFKRLGMPISPQFEIPARPPTQLAVSIPLTVKEYEKLGKPTVFDELKMEMKVA